MKKALSGVLAALVLLSSLPTTMTASALPDNSGAESRNVAHTLYVSTAGNDNTGDGTPVSYTHLSSGSRLLSI